MMKRQIIVISILTIMAIVFSVSCTGTAGEYTHKILATGEYGINEYGAPPPGEAAVFPREYEGAPPLVPHGLSGLTISRELNPCFNCHVLGVSLSPDHVATKVPQSHYTDLVTTGQDTDVNPLRYNCLICHIPQTSPEPSTTTTPVTTSSTTTTESSTTQTSTTSLPTSTTTRMSTFGQLAQEGEEVYASFCLRCHGNNLTGQYNRLSAYKNADRLLGFIKNQMPPGGSLGEQEYWQVLAYLLVENKFVPGETVFDPGSLSEIPLTSR